MTGMWRQPAFVRAGFGRGFLALVISLGTLVMVLTADAETRATVQECRKGFEAADAQLNRAYKALRAELSKEQFEKLRVLQRDWIQYRDDMAESRPRFNGVDTAKPKTTADYWEAMAQLTQDRIEFLRVYSGKGISKGISGTYQDYFGGDLTLKETKRGVEFSLDVVRGPTAHTGDIKGLAQRTGNKAAYKEVLSPEDKQAYPGDEPCELTFTFVDGHTVKVEGKNTSHYHGIRAYFDGVYYKVK